MLVLTRKTGEAIQIGDQVTIEVLEMRGGRVRLGITAPSDVGIRRQEIVVDTPDSLNRAPMPSVTAAIQRGRAVPIGT